MVKKAFALLLFAMILGANAQDRLANLGKIEKVNGTLGSYWERHDYQRIGTNDYDWGTAYLQLYAETGTFANINFGAEFFGHTQLWDSSTGRGLATDKYDVDIEPDSRDLSLLFMQYTQGDLIQARIGRIDDMKVSHLDDNRYEGAIVKVKPGDSVVLSVGAIRAFGEIDYDDAEKMTYFDRLNGGTAAEYLGFAEARVKVCPGFNINPYTYWHHDYASVYGLDTDTHISIGDKSNVGLLAQGYYVNSETGTDDAEANWHLSLYTNLAIGSGKLTVRVGESQMDGKNTPDNDMSKPAWFRDYMVFNDQTQLSYYQGCRADYAYVKFSMAKWWVSLYGGTYDYNTGNVDNAEFQVGYKITKKLDVNLRFINNDFDDGGAHPDVFRHEGRIQYKF